MRKETYLVEVTNLTLPGSGASSDLITSSATIPLELELDTSYWTENQEEGRRVRDIALFSIRLWKRGLFGLRRAVRRTNQEEVLLPKQPIYYDIPYTTWKSGQPIELPLSIEEIKSGADEIQGIAEKVNNLQDMDNPILRRFAYFYFYPVGSDRLLMLTMACDGLLIPVYDECESSANSFNERMERVRKDPVNFTEIPSPPTGFSDSEIYHARNGLAHAKEYGARTNKRELNIENCCIYLDGFLRGAIPFFLTQDLLEDRHKRADWFRKNNWTCSKKK